MAGGFIRNSKQDGSQSVLFCDVVQAGLKVTSYRRMTTFLIFCLHFPSAGTEGVNQPNDLLTVYDLHPQSVSVI